MRRYHTIGTHTTLTFLSNERDTIPESRVYSILGGMSSSWREKGDPSTTLRSAPWPAAWAGRMRFPAKIMRGVGGFRGQGSGRERPAPLPPEMECTPESKPPTNVGGVSKEPALHPDQPASGSGKREMCDGRSAVRLGEVGAHNAPRLVSAHRRLRHGEEASLPLGHFGLNPPVHCLELRS